VINSPQAYAALQYGPEQGTALLIQALIEKTNCEQDLAIRSENIIVTAGSTGAVDMLARLYAGPGAVVLVESPTYADALHVFRDHNVELHAIPMDEDGLLPDALEKQLMELHARGRAPRLLYTIPNFHNPTGHTLSLARRQQIIALARAYGLPI